MAKQTKVRSDRITAPVAADDPVEKYTCITCGKKYKRQKLNFPPSQSPLYKANNGHLPTCRHCIDELVEQYTDILGSEKDAMRRVCMKFDIYWNGEIYETIKHNGVSHSRAISYISRVNMVKYHGKTYDSTLSEECSIIPSPINETYAVDECVNDDIVVIDDTIKNFWGLGLSDATYYELNSRYTYWMSQYPEGTELDIGSQAILRQICNLEIDINRARAANKSIDRYVSTLNSLLGSANLKPVQKKEAESVFIPFGVEIANFEKEHPIVEPDPDFQDVDGIRHKVTAWFLGHLCKMCGIKNSYVEEYEKEIQEYTIERPSYEEDESDMSDSIFEDGGVENG